MSVGKSSSDLFRNPPPPAPAMPQILLAIPHLILYTASKENSIYGCNNFISSMAIPDAAESNAALDMSQKVFWTEAYLAMSSIPSGKDFSFVLENFNSDYLRLQQKSPFWIDDNGRFFGWQGTKTWGGGKGGGT